MFVHLDQVDEAGHEYGFAPDSSEYQTAFKQALKRIERILQAIEAQAASVFCMAWF